MKKSSRQIAVLTALFLLANCLTVFAANTEELPEAAITAVTPDTPLADDTPLSDETLFLDKTPAFRANIEYSFQGYVVKGTITETPPDVSFIQTMYSLDGHIYHDCEEPWDLCLMDRDDDGILEKLQNQTCLYSSQEPLKSYLDKKLDRFFLKLRLVLKNGTTYETQEVLIDRGEPQAVPGELVPNAAFAPSIAAYEMRPFCSYGKYQLTVREDASPEEIASCLPDTLPVEIQLFKGLQIITAGIVDCPVTWKSLSLPRLTAGESVTIQDAAEPIVIPEGTLLNTPTGIFRLDEPLGLYEQHGLTDEVRLILNVVSRDEAPTGALSAENTGLEMAFHLKPTGATEIKAYVWSENNPTWTSLPDALLLDAVNAQPSTPNSGYALVIGCGQEPYRSYLEEKAAGNSPVPFVIGLTIKGGVYDGKQLILTWPDTYELPLSLPKLGGGGGNELNAGAGNENNSTPEGQRPNLPPNTETHISTKDFVSHDNESGRTDHRRESDHPSYHPVSYIWLPLSNTSDAPRILETGINKKEGPTTAALSVTENEARTKTARQEPQEPLSTESTFTSPVQDKNTDTMETPGIRDTSGIQEIPVRSTTDKSHRLFSPLAALTIILLGMVAALIFIGKLHHKRRALPRH